MNNNKTEESISVLIDGIVNNDIISCESALFSEVNKIAYEVETSLSELLYENFENLFEDNNERIEEIELKIEELEEEMESKKSKIELKKLDTDMLNMVENSIENLEIQIEDLRAIIEDLEAGQEEPQEILEVWKISSWLYEELKKQGEPVLDSGFGCYWGRTCSGQSIKMDSCINLIAKSLLD